MLLSNDCLADPRVEKEAAALAAAGHAVTVVAWDRSGSSASIEARDGFEIRRLGPRAQHGGGLRNLPLYRAFWRAAVDEVLRMGADFVHCHDADTLPAGLAARKKSGGKVSLVCDFHELYRATKMIPQQGLPGVLARAAVDWVERRAVREAALVVLANPSAADHYRAIGAAEKIVFVENAPDLNRFRPEPDSDREHDTFTVCYIGQKRYLRPLQTLIAAVKRLHGVQALLAGGGTVSTEVERLAAGEARIEVVGRVTYDEIPSLYLGCDAVYAAIDARIGNPTMNFPVKAYEGMALGLPVLVSEGSWVAGYVEKHGIGYGIDDGSVESVASALSRLMSDPQAAREMGARGRELVVGGLNWGAASSRLVAAYEMLEESL